MSVEGLRVPGLEAGMGYDYQCNPTGQSFLITNETRAIVARPMRAEYGSPIQRDELEMRTRATALHRESLPKYTLPTEFAILQGVTPDGENLPVPLLARFMPKINNLQTTCTASFGSIVRDGQVCNSLAEINAFYLRQLVFHSRRFDGVCDPGGTCPDYPPVVRRIISQLTSNNVFIGWDGDGDKRVFCDPDAYVDLTPLREVSNKLFSKNLKTRIKHGLRLTARVLFYSAAAGVHKFINHDNEPKSETAPASQ